MTHAKHTTNRITLLLITILLIVAIGGFIAGCRSNETTSLSGPAPSVTEAGNLLVGSHSGDTWGLQYTEGHSYVLVGLPFGGVFKIVYTVKPGASFALFIESSGSAKVEIGLAKDAEGNLHILTDLTVTYVKDGSFSSKPENAVVGFQAGSYRTYHRKVDETTTHAWWPADTTGFEFSSTASEQVLMQAGRVSEGLSTDLGGPFEKPKPTPTPSQVGSAAEPLAAACAALCTAEGWTYVGHAIGDGAMAAYDWDGGTYGGYTGTEKVETGRIKYRVNNVSGVNKDWGVVSSADRCATADGSWWMTTLAGRDAGGFASARPGRVRVVCDRP